LQRRKQLLFTTLAMCLSFGLTSTVVFVLGLKS
jgi:hypothetical protein